MSLITCPECAHEVSVNAAACPNCGYPIQAAPQVEKIVDREVVAAPVVAPERREGFPPWAIVPIVLAAVGLFFLMYLLFRSDDPERVSVNVNANRSRAQVERETRTSDVPATDTQTVTVPPSESQPPIDVPAPARIPETTTVPPSAPPPTKGSVVINARVMPPRAREPAAARNTRFYLLDKDVEEILSEARVEPIEGNSLAASIGLAAVYPDRYGDFMRAAMRAIQRHVKYSGTTDGTGRVSLSNVEPDEYHLFAITRIGGGFAFWNAPVSVTSGQNNLELSPQSVTEIRDTSG